MNLILNLVWCPLKRACSLNKGLFILRNVGKYLTSNSSSVILHEKIEGKEAVRPTQAEVVMQATSETGLARRTS